MEYKPEFKTTIHMYVRPEIKTRFLKAIHYENEKRKKNGLQQFTQTSAVEEAIEDWIEKVTLIIG